MEDKKTLSAADILSANDLLATEVEVPEWGGTVRIRPLSAAEAMSFVEANKEKKGTDSAVRLVILSVVAEDGTPLFKPEQIEALKSKSMKAMMRIQKVALQLNGLGDEEATKAAKND